MQRPRRHRPASPPHRRRSAARDRALRLQPRGPGLRPLHRPRPARRRRAAHQHGLRRAAAAPGPLAGRQRACPAADPGGSRRHGRPLRGSALPARGRVRPQRSRRDRQGQQLCSINATCVVNAACQSSAAVNYAKDAVAGMLFQSGASLLHLHRRPGRGHRRHLGDPLLPHRPPLHQQQRRGLQPGDLLRLRDHLQQPELHAALQQHRRHRRRHHQGERLDQRLHAAPARVDAGVAATASPPTSAG